MKSIYLILISSLLLNAQNFWFKTSFPSGTQLNSVYNLLCLPDNSVLAGTFAIGIYKSTDNGLSWNPSGLENQWVRKMAKDNQNNIYAISIGSTFGSGIFKSTNSGISWSRKFEPPHQGITCLLVDASNNIYFGMNFADGQGEIYKSTNGGDSWMKIFNLTQNIFALTKTNSGRIIAASNGKVFYSDNDGSQWNEYSFGINFTSSDLVKDNSGAIYLSTEGYGIYKSVNNGQSWSSIRGAGPEYSCLLIDPNNHIYAGTRGYWVYRSTDSGNNWELVNSGMGNENFVLSLFSSSNGYIYAGMDYYGIYRSANVVNVEDEIHDEISFDILQNYPNPFNSQTNLVYCIPPTSYVDISLFDLNGQRVKVIFNGYRERGRYE